MQDKTICHILEWTEAGKRPEWASISHLDCRTKAYWAQWDSLAVKEGVLYQRWELTAIGKVTWQLELPKGLCSSVFKQLHDNPVGGHLGFSKTLAKAVKGSTGFIAAVTLKNGVKGATSVLLEKALG